MQKANADAPERTPQSLIKVAITKQITRHIESYREQTNRQSGATQWLIGTLATMLMLPLLYQHMGWGNQVFMLLSPLSILALWHYYAPKPYTRAEWLRMEAPEELVDEIITSRALSEMYPEWANKSQARLIAENFHKKERKVSDLYKLASEV